MVQVPEKLCSAPPAGSGSGRPAGEGWIFRSQGLLRPEQGSPERSLRPEPGPSRRFRSKPAGNPLRGSPSGAAPPRGCATAHAKRKPRQSRFSGRFQDCPTARRPPSLLSRPSGRRSLLPAPPRKNSIRGRPDTVPSIWPTRIRSSDRNIPLSLLSPYLNPQRTFSRQGPRFFLVKKETRPFPALPSVSSDFFPTKRGRASPASVYTGCSSYLRRQILQDNCIYRGAKDHSQLTVCA